MFRDPNADVENAPDWKTLKTNGSWEWVHFMGKGVLTKGTKSSPKPGVIGQMIDQLNQVFRGKAEFVNTLIFTCSGGVALLPLNPSYQQLHPIILAKYLFLFFNWFNIDGLFSLKSRILNFWNYRYSIFTWLEKGLLRNVVKIKVVKAVILEIVIFYWLKFYFHMIIQSKLASV